MLYKRTSFVQFNLVVHNNFQLLMVQWLKDISWIGEPKFEYFTVILIMVAHYDRLK